MPQITLAGQTLNVRDILREDMAQVDHTSVIHSISPRSLFVFDTGALLPTAGAADDLGFYQGTHATHIPYIGTGDVKAATTQRKARFTFALPPEYEPGGAVVIRLRAGMVTTVAGTSATIDVTAYKANGAVITGSDLITTAATSINSLTWANYDFTITPTGLLPGDEFDVLIVIDVVDAATGTAVIAGFRPFFGCTSRG